VEGGRGCTAGKRTGVRELISKPTADGRYQHLRSLRPRVCCDGFADLALRIYAMSLDLVREDVPPTLATYAAKHAPGLPVPLPPAA
jgi:hypothetical protein